MAFAIGAKRISSMWRALGAIPDDAWRDALWALCAYGSRENLAAA